MKKTDKKRENELIKALTQVCDWAQQEVAGFEWITHQVNFSKFEQSLRITCVFSTDEDIKQANQDSQSDKLVEQIVNALAGIGMILKQPAKRINFDSEEACLAQHGGNWAQRLSAH